MCLIQNWEFEQKGLFSTLINTIMVDFGYKMGDVSEYEIWGMFQVFSFWVKCLNHGWDKWYSFNTKVLMNKQFITF